MPWLTRVGGNIRAAFQITVKASSKSSSRVFEYLKCLTVMFLRMFDKYIPMKCFLVLMAGAVCQPLEGPLHELELCPSAYLVTAIFEQLHLEHLCSRVHRYHRGLQRLSRRYIGLEDLR